MEARVVAPTVDAIIAAIQSATDSEPDGVVTMLELCERTGWHIDKGRAEIKRLMLAGRIEVVKVWRPAIDGVKRAAPAYRLK